MTPTHAFVVPAYEKSPYLEECLQSLAAQKCRSSIVVSTSTPFTGLSELCERYSARLHVHQPNRGIGRDWNTALTIADVDWVTLAHQDDRYDSGFVKDVMATAGKFPDAAFIFSNGEEIGSDGRVLTAGANQRVKEILVALACMGTRRIRNAASRRVLLGFGNAVSCPAVTINIRCYPDFRFKEDLRTNMDWMAWVELSRLGEVISVVDRLVQHRVHADSETARCLSDGARAREDRMVFNSLWPSPVAAILQKIYATSYKGYAS